MTGYLTYALADAHNNHLRSRAESLRRVTKDQRRAARRPRFGGVRRLRRAFA